MATTVKNDKPGNLIIIGIATARDLYSGNFLMGFKNMQAPINCTAGPIKVVGKPVDEARNELVDIAIKNGAKYLMMIDDDVLVPNDALIRLFHQLHGQDEMIASGVYYTKTQPSTAIVLDKNNPGGIVNYRQGEVIHADYVGCGCMLIDMSVFDQLEKPYFKFNRCRPDIDPAMGAVGEDVWFCDKVAALGYRVVVDTNVQCGHEDFANKLVYQYDKRFGTGVWMEPGTTKVFYFPTAKQAEKLKTAEPERTGGKIAWGYDDMDGWTASPAGDFMAIRTQHDGITEAKVRRLLEYRPNEQAHGIIKALHDVMAIDGTIEIIVPDAAERFIYDDSTQEDIEKVVGAADAKHVALYNLAWVQNSMESAGFTDISITKLDETKEILAKGKK